jgi:hypothetical protein
MHRGRLLAVRLRYSQSDFGTSGPYIAETFGRTPSYLCAYRLQDFPAGDGWRDDRYCGLPFLPAGQTSILDLRHAWRTDARAPFDDVHLNVPQTALDEYAEQSGCRRSKSPPHRPSPL